MKKACFGHICTSSVNKKKLISNCNQDNYANSLLDCWRHLL